MTRPLLAFILTLMLLAGAPAQALVVQATLDTTTVTLSDSVVLSVSVDETVDSGKPDFSALKKDFEILRSGTESSTRLWNGQSSSVTTWRITLRPRRTGTLTIPAFTYDGVSSKPLTLTVKGDSPDKAKPSSQLVFLDLKVDRQDPWVQEQVIVTLNLYQRVDTNDPSLSWPEGQGYIREKLGATRVYQTVIDGHEFQVTENRFAIFPQKSGDITLPAATFTAFIAVGGSAMFDPFLNTSGKQIGRRTQEITLRVKAKPADFPADASWLPSPRVLMEDTVTPDKSEFRVGEPITRTITLQAHGIAPSVLPPLPPPAGDGYKVYPEKAKTAGAPVDEGYVSQRQEAQAFIPTRPGPLVLPAIEVRFWNTRTQTVDTTSLPARTVTVVAAPGTTPATPPVSGPGALTGDDAAPPSLQSLPTPHPPTSIANNPLVWQGLFAAALAGWLATVAFWVWQRRKAARRPVDPESEATERRLKELRKALSGACSQNNPQAARKALLAWFPALSGGKKVNSLGQLGHQAMSALLIRACADLDAALYSGKTSGAWQGDTLRKAIADEESQRRIKSGRSKEALANLYPGA